MVSVWLCVPSPWKTPGSGIAGSQGRSVFGPARDRHAGPQRQGAGPGEVLHFRFHSLETDGFVLLWGKVHSDPYLF